MMGARNTESLGGCFSEPSAAGMASKTTLLMEVCREARSGKDASAAAAIEEV